MHSIFSLITVLGFGSIVAAFIGWRVAIANHRQAWINALRDDIATYLKELEATHYALGDLLRGDGDIALEQKKREARLAILFIYWRIVLRLNQTEQIHIDLRKGLDDLMTVSQAVPDRAKIEAVLDLARKILKREWEVTKYDFATKPILWFKNWRHSKRDVNVSTS